MGREARLREAGVIVEQDRRVFWVPCPLCGIEWPWPAKPQMRPKTYSVCQVCLWTDICRMMRECPERFRFIPSARIMQDLPVIYDKVSHLSGEPSSST